MKNSTSGNYLALALATLTTLTLLSLLPGQDDRGLRGRGLRAAAASPALPAEGRLPGGLRLHRRRAEVSVSCPRVTTKGQG